MELQVNEYQLPAKIEFNFEELKIELAAKVEKYQNLIYTEDQIKEAKADRSSLNKLKKAIQDERIRRKKEYLKPFEEFEGKVNEIISIIDSPVQLIDTQIKGFEEKKKQDKQLEINQIWEASEHPDFLTLDKISDPRWLNASYSMKQIREDINGWINKVKSEMSVLEQLEAYSFEAIEVYKRGLDLTLAISEGKRLLEIQKKKEEAAKRAAEIAAQEEARRAEEEAAQKATEEASATTTAASIEEPEEIPVEEEKSEIKASTASWINFSAFLTIEQALKLKAFFEENQIEFKKI